MRREVNGLAAALTEAGGTVVAENVDGAFSSTTVRLNGVDFQLLSEYGRWRVNIGLVGTGSVAPASFWLAALSGEDTFPDPPTTDEDLTRAAAHFRALVSNATTLSARVERMAKQYSESMKQRLQ